MKQLGTALLITLSSIAAIAQKDSKTTEVWEGEPKLVKAGIKESDPPSDAIILLGATTDTAWQQDNGKSFQWLIENGVMTVSPGSGGVHSKQKFGDCQLHVEWRSPADAKGEGQNRGNSGIFLMRKYEVQVLDSYNNRTYSNGQAGSIYKQHIPLVNACKAPGEWQSFDIIFTAPRRGTNGNVIEPARFTVFQNGVLIQNNVTVWGSTFNTGSPVYEKHEDKEPISIQDHGQRVSFRNIWVRPL